jgi:hypothetical protein
METSIPNPLFAIGEIVDGVNNDGKVVEPNTTVLVCEYVKDHRSIFVPTGKVISYTGYRYKTSGQTEKELKYWWHEPNLRKRPDAHPMFDMDTVKEDMKQARQVAKAMQIADRYSMGAEKLNEFFKDKLK